MAKKTYFKPYIHYLIYFISATLYSYFLGVGVVDDGLRHIAFANNHDAMHSWGEVFPYSLFTDYDPWFGWHFILNKLLIFLTPNQTQLVVNGFSLFFLMLLVDKILRVNIKYKLDSLLYILVLIIVILTSYRYVMVRPDMLSGFYIMIAILLRNNFMSSLILTIFYGPFYYLFFLYTGSIGLVYLIQQKLKSFFGVVLGTILTFVFYFWHDFQSYIDTVHNILIDQKLRMGVEVAEGRPIFDFLTNLNYFILLPIFFSISVFLIYKNYNYFRTNTLATFLLITSILWLNQYRYYHLFLPIIFVYLISIIFNTNKKSLFNNLRKYQVLLKRFFSYSKNKKLFYLIAIPYSIFMLAYIYSGQSYTKGMELGKFSQEKRFDNKLILSNTMNPEMYSMIYYNPTIKTIPSCSIGWFNGKTNNKNNDEDLKNIYIDMVSPRGIEEEKLKELIDSVNADFYIHYMNYSKQILDFDKLRSLGIIPKEIYKNKIIFEVKK